MDGSFVVGDVDGEGSGSDCGVGGEDGFVRSAGEWGLRRGGGMRRRRAGLR